MSNTTITLPAFAKINWRLRVLGRRADGYHELDTVLQTISLHDAVSIVVSDDDAISLSCDDPSLPTDNSNLVRRAANALRSRYSISKGAKIRLEKRIPMEAGLGGGSADAAMALLGLAQLWEVPATRDQLVEIAGRLGADVPFFLCGGTARGTGIGATITPLGVDPQRFVLVVKPNAGVSTATAYESLKSPPLTTSATDTILSGSPASRVHDLEPEQFQSVENDFDAPISKLEPEIGRAKQALLTAGASVAMLSGSGSAVFGFFDNQEIQERAISAIELESGWRVFPCTTVGRERYRRALGSGGLILPATP